MSYLQYWTCGDTCHITNFRSDPSRCIVIDAEDVEKVQTACKTWFYHASRGYVIGYRQNAGKRETLMLHRVIMDASEGLVVDHISGDVLNNRKQNLRVTTQSANLGNQRRSGLVGVQKNMDGTYKASICYKGKRSHLGVYACAEDAARAYNRKSRELRGEHHTLNDVVDPYGEPVKVVDGRGNHNKGRFNPIPKYYVYKWTCRSTGKIYWKVTRYFRRKYTSIGTYPNQVAAEIALEQYTEGKDVC